MRCAPLLRALNRIASSQQSVQGGVKACPEWQSGNNNLFRSTIHLIFPEPTPLIFVICHPMRRILHLDLDGYAAADSCILFMKLSID
jgi:hypothetical protein